MFYPATMNKILIGVHHAVSEAFITGLHEAGIVEIRDIRETADETGLKISGPGDPVSISRIISLQQDIDHLITTGEPFLPSEGGIRSWLTPPSDIRVPSAGTGPDAIGRRAEEVIAEAAPMLTTAQHLSRLEEGRSDLAASVAIIDLLSIPDLDPSEIRITQFTGTIAGVLRKEDAEAVEAEIHQGIPDEVIIRTRDVPDGVLMVIITTTRYLDILTEILRVHRFRRITPPPGLAGKPTAIREVLRQEEEEISGQVAADRSELTRLAAERMHGLRAIREDLSYIRERYDIARRFGSSRDVVFIEGWIAEKDIGRLAAISAETGRGEVFWTVHEPQEGENIPVRYDNPSWLRPFEFLTTMFAPPRYGEIDPTPLFAPAFILFFGLMLGDAGYGIIIMLAAWLLYRGAGQRDEMTGNMCIVLMACGASDIICGILQGGWFGDLLPRFLGITPPFVLIEPLRSPILFFQLSLIIGIIHINLGIFLGFWQHYQKREWRQAFDEHLIWYIIQPAAAVLLIGFFGWTTFPDAVVLGAGAVMAGSLIFLFLSSGPMFFFSLTGFLGDWLSYVRILALALATGGIAMTINLLAEMIASAHPLLFIPAILFCIAGQTFNLVIQVLGSVIHALRLHYIEFFGKFYTGGGRQFHPFTTRREYTTMHQERDLL